MSKPTAARLIGAVHAFDDAVDQALDTVRGHPLADRFFTAATHSGEFSAIWHVAGIARGLATGRVDQTIALTLG
ncbi:MAG TPA: hypothetical protein VMM60_01760, partial [Ilumatobacter sp.]|nr:hypothetical protein [Ilumatobacter sp.]